MDNKFILLTKLEQTSLYINKELTNYPRCELVLKNRIENTLYDLMELIHSYRFCNNIRIRSKNLNDFVIKLSMLDYYLRVSYEKKIINKRKLILIGKFIIELRRIVYGVINEKKNSCV